MTDPEIERLAKLIEECGEVIQICGKILRHGYESTHVHYNNIPNRKLLEKELNDVVKSINLMCYMKDIKNSEVSSDEIPDMRYFHFQEFDVKD